MKRRLSRPARNDIAAILDWSHERFGVAGRRRYERLIARSLLAITNAVPPIGSRNADEIAVGLRLFHLRYARAEPDIETVGRPRHFIAYRLPEPDTVIVVRVLHDAMDMPARLSETDSA